MSKFQNMYLNTKLFKNLSYVKNTFFHKRYINYRKYTKSTNEFPKEYKSKIVENGKYEWWQNKQYFTPDVTKNRIFSMILPPPNITGFLHLGHALTVTIEDILVRWRRQIGDSVVWIPGIDHAGIATQVVVEKSISSKLGLTRHDIGREEFLKKIWEWRNEKGNHIEKQLSKLGLSLDWSKHIFTMDNKCSEAVNEAFVNLFEKGLIYRKNGIINWSCQLQSTISDIEIETHEYDGLTLVNIPGEEELIPFGQIYDFAYKTENGDDEIIVSTTRPETMIGDAAIAVHPNDQRYFKYHGKKFKHPFRKDLIPLIIDEMVDMNFGTGAVKITPAHSQIDFEIADNHQLTFISILNEKGKIINNEMFENLSRYEARKRILDSLQNLNLMKNIKDHKMSVPFCSRSGDAIEFLVKPQWFLKCEEMSKRAKDAVLNGSLTIDPKTFENEWIKWLTNSRDWCISRQLWWGHRIPIYHCRNKKDILNEYIFIAGRNEKEAVVKATSLLHIKQIEDLEIKQDDDVLDTWFSSSIFPLVACGWPKKDPNLNRYFPLNMIDTGHDILFFWVARIVMLSQTLTNQLPFKNILLHGMINDSFGRKMSKSLGNLILPEDIIDGISLEDLNKQVIHSYESGIISKDEAVKALENQKKLYPNGIPQCGTDALRFTLCSHNIKNLNIHFDVKECEKNRHFCNKMWQAATFILNSINFHGKEKCLSVNWERDLWQTNSRQNQIDKWILSRLSFMVHKVNVSLKEKEFHIGTAHLKKFLYNEFCNIYLETSKITLKKDQGNTEALNSCRILLHCFHTGLICLSPYMPFITEDLYQRLPIEKKDYPSIMIHPYPTDSEWAPFRDLNTEEQLSNIFEISNQLRRIIAMYGLNNESTVIIESEQFNELINNHKDTILKLSGINNFKLISKANEEIKYLSKEELPINVIIYFSLQKKFSFENQLILLEKEKKIIKNLNKLYEVYNSIDFINKASEQLKKDYEKKIERLKEKRNKIQVTLRHFKI